MSWLLCAIYILGCLTTFMLLVKESETKYSNDLDSLVGAVFAASIWPLLFLIAVPAAVDAIRRKMNAPIQK